MQENEHVPKQRSAAPGGTGLAKQMPAAMGISAAENTADAQLPVREMEMAEKLMELIKASILAEAKISMLAQANVGVEGLILLFQRSGKKI